MQVGIFSDITEYLKDNKIVFIFGEEDLSVNYPLNFKGIYGIDYEGHLPKPVGLGEIKRIFLTWQIRPASGVRTFFYAMLNYFIDKYKVPIYNRHRGDCGEIDRKRHNGISKLLF